MKSMTGFGRAEVESPIGKIVAEIQSVNRKYLEVIVFLPKEFSRFENAIRKQVNESVSRGSVSARIYLFPNSISLESSLPTFDTLQSLKKNWEELASSLGYERSTIDLPFLLKQAEGLPRIKNFGQEDHNPFEEVIQLALQGLKAMKEQEGLALAKDVADRLKSIGDHVTAIGAATPNAVQKLRSKLMEKMGEILSPGTELDERLFREVALYAEKLDISEEVTRFRSHIAQYEELLKTKEANGRKMDFLVQEMGREINTMGSKSMDATIAHLVVEVKSELEKIREQIQNIE